MTVLKGITISAILAFLAVATLAFAPRVPPRPVLPAGAQLVGMITCGTSATCASPAQVVGGTIVVGQVTLSSGTKTITGISPAFTSSSSFYCQAEDTTAANGTYVANQSGTSFIITGTGSDVVNWACFGN